MRLSILKVEGNSMHPTLESGAFVLVWHSKRLFKSHSLLENMPVLGSLVKSALMLKVDDIVVVNHPKFGQIIKRVAKIDYCSHQNEMNTIVELHKTYLKTRLRLQGDNPAASVSEEDIGWVAIEEVTAKVILSID